MNEREPGIVVAAAAVIALLLAPLSWMGNLREQLPPFLLLVTTSTLLLYALFRHLDRRSIEPSARTIIGVAIVLRLLLLPMAPSLSDDAWRYLWDGRLVLHGINPYHHLPADPALAPFADGLLALQGYPTTHTIYPPGAQLLFATAMALGEASGSGYEGGFFFWKILLVAAEIAAIVLLLRLLDSLSLPRRHAILYAWHPLVVVELAGQGHTDGLWVLSLALFLFMLSRRSAFGATAGMMIGALTRLFTLLLLPLWWRLSDRVERTAGIVTIAVLMILFLPLFEPRAFESFTSVGVRFTNYYEFNGGFYRLTKWLLDEARLAPSNAIAGAIGVGMQLLVFVVVWWRAGESSARNAGGIDRERSTSPDVASASKSERRLNEAGRVAVAASAAMAIITAQMFFGTKVHVWYFVAPLFLLTLLPEGNFRRAWLWASLAGPFTYLYYAWAPHAERSEVIMLEWGGFLLLVIIAMARRRRRLRAGSGEAASFASIER